MDFIQKQDLPVTQVGEDGGEIALDLYGGTSTLLIGHAPFISDDRRQCRLAQARWTVEKDVVQRFAARFGRFYSYRQIFFYLFLADEFAQVARTQLEFIRRVVFSLYGGHQAVFVHRFLFWCGHYWRW